MSRPEDNLTAEESSRLNQSMSRESSYNVKVREEQHKKLVQERVAQINKVREEAEYSREERNMVWLMNFVEKLLHACGGEKKANYLDVSRDFMKILTRVPLKANLHAFLPEDDINNPRFHKVTTQVLLELPEVSGVRWVPSEEGTFLIISIKRGE